MYNFLRSPDVAEHCRIINKTWNTYEMTIIIGRSFNETEEKRNALYELLELHPDMPSPPNSFQNPFESIHKEIERILRSNDLFNEIGMQYDWVYVDIPTPFKQGDILLRDGCENNIFVLDSLDSDNKKQIIKTLKIAGCDNYMTEGTGFFIGDDGILYSDHVHDNDTFKYYRGKLDGKYQLLHHVSKYLKTEINLPVLMENSVKLCWNSKKTSNVPF